MCGGCGSNFERTREPLQVLANYHHVTECGTSRHDVLIHLSKFLAATVAEYNLARISSVWFARLNIINMNAAMGFKAKWYCKQWREFSDNF